MTTPLNPTMDDAFVDTYYFLVPHRIVWDHWQDFMGVTDNGWTASTQYQVPLIHAPASTGVTKGTIADYMGIPKGITGIDYQALPFRAYVKIYNTWFRNSSLIAPAQLHTDDTDRNGDNTVAELGGTPFKASRIADYLSSCLPEPQKPIPGFSGGMTIPLGTTAPVRYNSGLTVPANTISAMVVYDQNGIRYDQNHTTANTMRVSNTSGAIDVTTTADTGTFDQVAFLSASADLTQATAATVNALRLSFQIQKLFELRARTGTGRYFDILKGEFGTAPNTSVLQEPEYLGGKRQPLNLTQIIQSSSTTGSGSGLKELGMTGGMSHTVFSNDDFTKSITEHSILIGIMVIRQYHTYQQGLDRMWSRRDKLDYYTPLLAHLGEQPVYKKEIMATGTSATDNSVWGYQERWGEYKYGKHIVTGEMNSSYAQSLDIWHYADKYASVPTLAQNWIEETPDYIDRTLAVAHTTADQFKFDIVTNITATRPMPVYCTPGLIDHF